MCSEFGYQRPMSDKKGLTKLWIGLVVEKYCLVQAIMQLMHLVQVQATSSGGYKFTIYQQASGESLKGKN